MSSGDLDIRLYSAAGARMNLPNDRVAGCSWELLERGGFGSGSLELRYTWETAPVSGGERVDVWLYGVLAYRGWVWLPERRGDPDEAITVNLIGLMERLNGYVVTRRYCYAGPTDLAVLFADLIADYVTIAGRLPSLVVDTATTSALVQSLDATGRSVAQALNQMCDLADGLVYWGCDVDGSGNDRVYLYRRPTTTAKRFSVGGVVTAFSVPADRTQVVNRIYLRGGEVAQPNLLTNGSFEQPVPPSETAGNLLGNYSFNWGEGVWTLSGGASTVDSGSAIANGVICRTGNWMLELDTPGESASQVVNIAYKMPLVMSCYARRESAGTAADLKLAAVGLNSSNAPVAGAAVDTGFVNVDGVTWKQHTLAVDFSAYPSVAKVQVTYSTSMGSEGNSGTLVDDAGLWEAGAVANSGWRWSVAGAAARQILDWVNDSVPAYHGGYCVKVQAGGIAGAGDYLELRTAENARFALRPGQLHTVGVFVQGNLSVSIGMTEYKADGTVAATTESSTDTANYTDWHLVSKEITTNASTIEGEIFIRVRNNNVTYVDAAVVLEGSLPTDWYEGGYWEGGQYERVLDVTDLPTSGFGRMPEGISSAAAASITTYGLRELVVQEHNVRDSAGAMAFALAYFNRHAVVEGQARLEIAPVTSASEMVDFSGLVRLLDLDGAPDALFPIRIAYRLGYDDMLSLSADLGGERAEMASQLRWLETIARQKPL